jgi:hypothetical protein
MTELNQFNQMTPVQDPKNVQELTNFVQITLQQMQDKFQSMSDQIINRNILLKIKLILIF